MALRMKWSSMPLRWVRFQGLIVARQCWSPASKVWYLQSRQWNSISSGWPVTSLSQKEFWEPPRYSKKEDQSFAFLSRDTPLARELLSIAQEYAVSLRGVLIEPRHCICRRAASQTLWRGFRGISLSTVSGSSLTMEREQNTVAARTGQRLLTARFARTAYARP